MSTDAKEDNEVERAVGHLMSLDPDGVRVARVLRETFDQLYDGLRTGRYRWDQLFKTEKTHFGTLIEINLHREFKFEDGEVLDYRLCGVEVDCKYSQTPGGWMIPLEAIGHLCLVVTAKDDASPRWSLGAVRVTPDRLNAGANRDKKATLNQSGKAAIRWLFQEQPLPPNVLQQLPGPVVDGIMAPQSGQKRVNELFRRTLQMRVGRAVVATVAQQEDYMKRVRENGGARTHLKAEGIVIFGDYATHQDIAQKLGLPRLERGEFVSARLVPASSIEANSAEIDGRFWRLASVGDPVVPAPRLPDVRGSRT